MKQAGRISPEWIKLILVVLGLTLITLPSYYFGQEFMYLNHDRNVHPIRLWHIENALYEGILMPNWISTFTNNMGSPVFLLNWFLPYYLAIVPRFLGFSLADSIKIIFLSTYIFSGFSFYLLAKQFFKHRIALAATIIFLILPYRYTLIFVRASFGEAVGLSLLPLFLYFWVNYKNKYVFEGTILSTFLLILSHNVVALYGACMAGLWVVWNIKNWRCYQKSIAGFLVGIFLATFFWLPAIVEKNLTHIQVARDWSADHFVSWQYLLASPARAASGLPHDLIYGMSLNIGIYVFILVIAGILWRALSGQISRPVSYLVLILILTILVHIPQAELVWQKLPILSLTIFPWRIHTVLVVVLALLAGFSLQVISRTFRWYLFAAVVISQLSWQQLWIPLTSYLPEKTYLPIWHDGSAEGEFLPATADRQEYKDWFYLQAPSESVWENTARYSFTQTQQRVTSLIATVKVTEPSRVVVNHYYFPGWQGEIDGNSIDISNQLEEYKGRINFGVEPGEHQLKLYFQATPIRLAARYISIITGVSLISYYVIKYRQFWFKFGTYA